MILESEAERSRRISDSSRSACAHSDFQARQDDKNDQVEVNNDDVNPTQQDVILRN